MGVNSKFAILKLPQFLNNLDIVQGKISPEICILNLLILTAIFLSQEKKISFRNSFTF